MNPGNLRRIGNRFTNWLVVDLSLRKNMKASWDYYSQYMENHKRHVPHHQPDTVWDDNQKILTSINHGGQPMGLRSKCGKMVLDTIAQHHHQIELAISALDVDA